MPSKQTLIAHVEGAPFLSCTSASQVSIDVGQSLSEELAELQDSRRISMFLVEMCFGRPVQPRGFHVKTKSNRPKHDRPTFTVSSERMVLLTLNSMLPRTGWPTYAKDQFPSFENAEYAHIQLIQRLLMKYPEHVTSALLGQTKAYLHKQHRNQGGGRGIHNDNLAHHLEVTAWLSIDAAASNWSGSLEMLITNTSKANGLAVAC